MTVRYQFFHCKETDEVLLTPLGWSWHAFAGGIFWAFNKGIQGKYLAIAAVGLCFILVGFKKVPTILPTVLLMLHWYIGDSGNRYVMQAKLKEWQEQHPGKRLSDEGGIVAPTYQLALVEAQKSIDIEKKFLEQLKKQSPKVVAEALDILDNADRQ